MSHEEALVWFDQELVAPKELWFYDLPLYWEIHLASYRLMALTHNVALHPLPTKPAGLHDFY